MSDTSAIAPDHTEAHRLVGVFLQSFAQLEQSLDSGIGKLLGLDEPKTDIVCSSIPFAKKVGVFFSAEDFQAEAPESKRKTQLKNVRSAILSLNTKRVMFAHNPFISSANGVEFRRVVADTKLNISTVILTSDEVKILCRKATEVAEEINELVATMKPFTPSLNFSDGRSSGYVALMS